MINELDFFRKGLFPCNFGAFAPTLLPETFGLREGEKSEGFLAGRRAFATLVSASGSKPPRSAAGSFRQASEPPRSTLKNAYPDNYDAKAFKIRRRKRSACRVSSPYHAVRPYPGLENAVAPTFFTLLVRLKRRENAQHF